MYIIYILICVYIYVCILYMHYMYFMFICLFNVCLSRFSTAVAEAKAGDFLGRTAPGRDGVLSSEMRPMPR